MKYSQTVERWCVFEVELQSSMGFAKPLHEVRLQASFQKGQIRKKVFGFYDCGSTWKIRFMPEEEGTYSFQISSNQELFNGLNVMKRYAPTTDPGKIEEDLKTLLK